VPFVYFRWSWSWSCYFGLGLKNLVLFASLPDPLPGGACYPLPEKYNARSIAPSASIFGPSGLIRQPLPTVIVSPMHKGLDKNTGSAHFRSQRKRQNAGSCIKNIPKNSGGRDSRTHAAEGETFVRTHPHAPARCWCPSASSRLATALFYTKF